MEETRNESPYSTGKDRISSLPDEIIHCIMSFNDTRKVVQTCVFSKKWIHIWKSVPFLSIKRSSFPRGEEYDEAFIKFDDMVFILRNESDMKRFALDGHPEALKIPYQLVNCKSLVNLRVDLGVICIDVILPKSMHLPPLKVLAFHGVSIPNEELSKSLFSSCPVLEKLCLFDCNIPNLTVNSLSLQKFLYHQSLSSTDNVVKLSTPNLKHFWCWSSVTQHYCLENCSLLSSVSFLLMLKERVLGENAEAYSNFPSQEEKVYAERMTNFLKAADVVKYMMLSYGFLEVLSEARDLLDFQPPRLFNLQVLSLEMRSTRGCLRDIAYLLNIYPHIEKITLFSKQSNLVEVGVDWEEGLSSPGMLSHLDELHFYELEGSDAELKLLSFIFKHAKVLRTVALRLGASNGSPDGVRMDLFREKVGALPIASSSIEIEFHFALLST